MSYKNILLIDDDHDDREIFIAALRAVSDTCSVISMPCGRQALQKLSGEPTDIDLIFLDLNMPLMNGQEFLALIKKNEALKDIPVVVLSTTSHEPTIETTRKLGAHGFFTKPTTFDELVSIVRSVIGVS